MSPPPSLLLHLIYFSILQTTSFISSFTSLYLIPVNFTNTTLLHTYHCLLHSLPNFFTTTITTTPIYSVLLCTVLATVITTTTNPPLSTSLVFLLVWHRIEDKAANSTQTYCTLTSRFRYLNQFHFIRSRQKPLSTTKMANYASNALGELISTNSFKLSKEIHYFHSSGLL